MIVFLLDAFCNSYLSSAVTPYLCQMRRRRLETLLGYSFGICPSIWTGTYPRTHNLWTEFYYAPRAPDEFLSRLRYFPHGKTGLLLKRIIFKLMSARFRNALPGMPIELEHYFTRHNIDYQRLLPSSVSVPSVADLLLRNRITYSFQSFANRIPSENEISTILERKATVNLFYLSKLDTLGHKYGPNASRISIDLQRIDEVIESSVNAIERSSDDVEVLVFSDHGMAPVTKFVDLGAQLPPQLRLGVDYLNFLDESLARFWFLRDESRSKIVAALRESNDGCLILNEDFKKYGLDFVDNRYGEVLFVMKQSSVIFPSFFGTMLKHSLRGMHGYLPSESLSPGVLFYEGRHEFGAESMSVVDVLPSMLRILHIPCPPWMEGRSFIV